MRKSALIISLASLVSMPVVAETRGTYLAVEVGYTTSDGAARVQGTTAEATQSTIPAADFEPEINWGLAFGYQLGNGLGLELEYLATTLNLDEEPNTIAARPELEAFLEGAETEDFNYNGEAEISTLSLNLSYHYLNRSRWTPYISAGVGYADVSATADYVEDPRFEIFALPANSFGPADSTGMTWNIGLGIAFIVNDAIHIEAEYVHSDYDTDLTSNTVENGDFIEFLDFSNDRFNLSFKLWL